MLCLTQLIPQELLKCGTQHDILAPRGRIFEVAQRHQQCDVLLFEAIDCRYQCACPAVCRLKACTLAANSCDTRAAHARRSLMGVAVAGSVRLTLMAHAIHCNAP
jgi:hypothetical protein